MARSKVVEQADPNIKKAEDAKKKEAERLEKLKMLLEKVEIF